MNIINTTQETHGEQLMRSFHSCEKCQNMLLGIIYLNFQQSSQTTRARVKVGRLIKHGWYKLNSKSKLNWMLHLVQLNGWYRLSLIHPPHSSVYACFMPLGIKTL